MENKDKISTFYDLNNKEIVGTPGPVTKEPHKEIPYRKIKAFAKQLTSHVMGDNIMSQNEIDFVTLALIDLVMEFNRQAQIRYDDLSDECKEVLNYSETSRNSRMIYDFRHGPNGNGRGLEMVSTIYDGMKKRIEIQKNVVLEMIAN